MAGIEGMSFDDADDWRAAAGDWLAELRPNTPDVVLEQIETAISADDQDTLAELRAVWWNPDHQQATDQQTTYREQPPVQHQAADAASSSDLSAERVERPPSVRGDLETGLDAPARPDVDPAPPGIADRFGDPLTDEERRVTRDWALAWDAGRGEAEIPIGTLRVGAGEDVAYRYQGDGRWQLDTSEAGARHAREVVAARDARQAEQLADPDIAAAQREYIEDGRAAQSEADRAEADDRMDADPARDEFLEDPAGQADRDPDETTTVGATDKPDGFVPTIGAEPDGRYETVSRAEAVERITAAGFDRSDAEFMVGEYVEANTARYGVPTGGWGFDQYDLAEVARGYEWVDHFRGETIADARTRAEEYTAGWAEQAATVDREGDPARAAHIDRELDLWADRAWPPRVVEQSVPEPEPPWAQQAKSAGWAVAARDAAIDVEDWASAAQLAADARVKLDTVYAAGASREELAVEWDYPGGADAIDGDHIDHLIAEQPVGTSSIVVPNVAGAQIDDLDAGEQEWADAHYAEAAAERQRVVELSESIGDAQARRIVAEADEAYAHTGECQGDVDTCGTCNLYDAVIGETGRPELEAANLRLTIAEAADSGGVDRDGPADRDGAQPQARTDPGPYPELAARVAAVHEQITDQTDADCAPVAHQDDVTDGHDEGQDAEWGQQ